VIKCELGSSPAHVLESGRGGESALSKKGFISSGGAEGSESPDAGRRDVALYVDSKSNSTYGCTGELFCKGISPSDGPKGPTGSPKVELASPGDCDTWVKGKEVIPTCRYSDKS
jgi:hypothetical protein